MKSKNSLFLLNKIHLRFFVKQPFILILHYNGFYKFKLRFFFSYLNEKKKAIFMPHYPIYKNIYLNDNLCGLATFQLSDFFEIKEMLLTYDVLDNNIYLYFLYLMANCIRYLVWMIVLILPY